MLHIKPIISSLLRSKSGPVLLLLQIILSVAIVANASFIIHERIALMQRDSGIAEEEVLTFSLYNFDERIDNALQNKQDQRILAALPHVQAVTSTNMIPLSGGGWSDVYVDSPDKDTGKSTPNFAFYLGNEQMLDTLGLKLIEGRSFATEEVLYNLTDVGAQAIVSQPLAKAFWGDESPVGKIMYQGTNSIKIVGVVDKLQGAWVDHDNFEYSVIQNVDFGGDSNNKSYMLRAKKQYIPELKEAIVKALHQENPNRVINQIQTVAEYKASSYRHHELMVAVLTLMVVLLLLITSLGLTGMVMFNIQRRTKQIGTRRALGAKKRDIISYFMLENYLICLVGGVLGGLLAIQLGQQLMAIYSLPMLEWQYPALTLVGLLIVTSLAVIVPATKAANISPAIATRSA
ncbi:ABC transporter permease [Shewanella sp.]|uniref:ABC transporter permease n=1 Tax=Shewanella sp. TaxID=50422 RepID=UPI0040546014